MAHILHGFDQFRRNFRLTRLFGQQPVDLLLHVGELRKTVPAGIFQRVQCIEQTLEPCKVFPVVFDRVPVPPIIPYKVFGIRRAAELGKQNGLSAVAVPLAHRPDRNREW